MYRMQFVEPDHADGPIKAVFKNLVLVPNVLCLMANSEPVIETYAGHHANLGKYKLSARFRKMLSLAVSQFNECDYCIALHTATAIDGGILTDAECLQARRMKSDDPKADALLGFAKEVLEKRGKVEDDMMLLIKDRGFGDREIVEILAVISFITLANFVANVGKPEIDFLEPPPLR